MTELPWERCNQVIASLDYAKQEDVRERVWQQHWDLVIIDEAHKCSARTGSGGAGREPKVVTTKRYELAAKLAAQCDHHLLLTATPHHGEALIGVWRIVTRSVSEEVTRSLAYASGYSGLLLAFCATLRSRPTATRTGSPISCGCWTATCFRSRIGWGSKRPKSAATYSGWGPIARGHCAG